MKRKKTLNKTYLLELYSKCIFDFNKRTHLNKSGDDADLSLSFLGLPRPFFLGDGSRLDLPKLADNVGKEAMVIKKIRCNIIHL